MIKIDMHVHSKYSHDGFMSVKKIIETARLRGLDGVAITDHNKFGGSAEALFCAPNDFLVIPGAELSTSLGHMLCYFVTEPPEAFGVEKKGKTYDFFEIAEYVKKCGGLLFAAHPYRLGDARTEMLGFIDGLEAYNGRNSSKKGDANEKARKLAIKIGCPISAGSDAHIPAEIGTGVRCFDLPRGCSADEIKNAMKKPGGTYIGKYSPLVREASSGIVTGFKLPDAKRIGRNFVKLVQSVYFDPTCKIRAASRDVCGKNGKIFEITATNGENK